MGRPKKVGFDFFRVKETLFNDPNTLMLMNKYPLKGIGLYIHILSQLYAEKENREPGYYLNFNEIDIFKLSRCTMADDEQLIKEIVNYLCELNFFDERMLKEKNILTAAYIQERFIEMSKKCDRTEESYHIREEFRLINQISTLETHISPKETNLSPQETQVSSLESAPNKANGTKPNQKNSEANIISLFNEKFINRERILEVFLIEKNYDHSEYEKFINHYEKSGWLDKNGNRVKKPLAAAQSWVQKAGLTYVKPEFHKEWKKLWAIYRDQWGFSNATHLLEIKPKLINRILYFTCSSEIRDICELNISPLKNALRTVFGKSILLEYIIENNDIAKSS